LTVKEACSKIGLGKGEKKRKEKGIHKKETETETKLRIEKVDYGILYIKKRRSTFAPSHPRTKKISGERKNYAQEKRLGGEKDAYRCEMD